LYRSDGESSDLRIFYLPFRLRWSGHNPPNPPLAKSVRVGTTVVPTLETDGGERGFSIFSQGAGR
jgi:hypothetical protein